MSHIEATIHSLDQLTIIRSCLFDTDAQIFAQDEEENI